jgi:hypothetical protein
MRIAVMGGGPAGLYFATLWKTRHPKDDVQVYEQNPADATFGFGVVFSDRALEFLRDDDPETCDLIASHMETWRDMTLIHRGEAVTIDGSGSLQSAACTFSNCFSKGQFRPGLLSISTGTLAQSLNWEMSTSSSARTALTLSSGGLTKEISGRHFPTSTVNSSGTALPRPSPPSLKHSLTPNSERSTRIIIAIRRR